LGLMIAVAALSLIAAYPSALTMPMVCTALGLAGVGIGTVFPVTTVSVQNAVPPYQLGTATGAMNFFRQLAGALIVAVFGAIVLGGAGSGQNGLTLETLATQSHHATSAELAMVFRLVFVAAASCLVVGLALLFTMEERPLRGRAT